MEIKELKAARAIIVEASDGILDQVSETETRPIKADPKRAVDLINVTLGPGSWIRLITDAGKGRTLDFVVGDDLISREFTHSSGHVSLDVSDSPHEGAFGGAFYKVTK